MNENNKYILIAGDFILLLIPNILFLTLQSKYFYLHPFLNIIYILIIFFYYKYLKNIYEKIEIKYKNVIFSLLSLLFLLYYFYLSINNTIYLLVILIIIINIIIVLKNINKTFILLNFIIIIIFFSLYNPSVFNIISLIFLYYLYKDNIEYLKIGFILLISFFIYPAVGLIDGISKGIYDRLNNKKNIILYKCYKNIGCGIEENNITSSYYVGSYGSLSK